VPAGAGHGRRWVAPAAFERIERRADRILRRFFDRNRLARGMPKAEAVERILPGRAAELSDVYLPWLERQGVLATTADQVDLPGRESPLDAHESSLADSVVAAFDAAGLTPPSPPTVCEKIGAKRQIFDGVLRYLVDGGRLLRLKGGLIVSRSAIDRLREELVASDWERFSVAQFKDRFGLTRKWAIPLLELLDQSRVTRRVGDHRQILRPPSTNS
jgi:selenocysteine-specific elongation factor